MNICMMVYSAIYIMLFRGKYFTSMHRYLDLTSDMALFTWSFMVVKYDVGVMTSSG